MHPRWGFPCWASIFPSLRCKRCPIRGVLCEPLLGWRGVWGRGQALLSGTDTQSTRFCKITGARWRPYHRFVTMMSLAQILRPATRWALAAFTAHTAFAAGPEFMTGWDFSQKTDYDNLSGIHDWDLGSTGDHGAIYWDGQFGSTAFDYIGYDKDVIGFVGTSVNSTLAGDVLIEKFSDQESRSVHESLGFYTVNGKFVIEFSTTNYTGISLTYAAMRSDTGVDAANKVDWEYSTDGSTYTPAGISHDIGAGAFGLYQVDLTAVSSLNNQPHVYLRATMSGANGNRPSFNAVLCFDNIQVIGTPMIAAPNPFSSLLPNEWAIIEGWGWNFSYDPSSGWVYNQTIGWMYVNTLPWIYSPKRGEFLYAF